MGSTGGDEVCHETWLRDRPQRAGDCWSSRQAEKTGADGSCRLHHKTSTPRRGQAASSRCCSSCRRLSRSGSTPDSGMFSDSASSHGRTSSDSRMCTSVTTACRRRMKQVQQRLLRPRQRLPPANCRRCCGLDAVCYVEGSFL